MRSPSAALRDWTWLFAVVAPDVLSLLLGQHMNLIDPLLVVFPNRLGKIRTAGDDQGIVVNACEVLLVG